MNEIEQNEMKTNQAWENLYNRLNQEGLIPENAHLHSHRATSPLHARWVAVAAVLLCICTATFFMVRSTHSNPEKNLLSIKNERGAVTLVTTLEDGSIVYLADNTVLHYPEHFSSDKREVVLQGSALFDVQGNNKCPFYIETTQVIIEVVGTSFNINSLQGELFELAVKTGKVKVTSKKSNETVWVEAGETVTLSEQNKLTIVNTEDPEQFLRLMECIRFKDEKLKNILEVINRRNNDIILKTYPSTENLALTFTFAEHSNEQIAELICVALNLTNKKEDNVIYLSD